MTSTLCALGATPAAAAPCEPAAGSSTVARSVHARVTVETRPARVWRGCATSAGTDVELERGRSGDGQRTASAFRLAGGWVAYLVREADDVERVGWLALVDLTTGTRWSTARVRRRGGGFGITHHAVSDRGDLAWIRATNDQHGERQWRLYLRRDEKVTLRYRSRARLTGLALTPTRLRWREGGRVRTRSLP